MKLLYAEDERAMSEAVVDILTFHKYSVDAVYDGKTALDYTRNEKYDGIILDIMMPEMSGTDVLKKIRSEGINTPVLLLSAKSEIEDKIEGLDLGADDYLTKPFNMGELLARVRAMLRRREEFTPDILSIGDVSLNRQNFELYSDNGSFILTGIEYKMMELFMLNRGTYISTEDILCRVWGYDTDAEIGIVWVYITYLRKKLLSLGGSVEIKARRGVGYTLEAVK